MRYTNRRLEPQEFNEDVLFWNNFHVDWYESVILTKTHPTTEMKSINWDTIMDIDLEHVVEAMEACSRMHLIGIMGFN